MTLVTNGPLLQITSISPQQRYDAHIGLAGGDMSLRTKVKAEGWETRAWDFITVGVMLLMAVTCALWMVKS